MNKYEIIFILEQNVSDLTELEGRVLNLLTDAEDLKVKKWGLKKFAYPIKKQDSGHYYQVNVRLNATVANGLTPKLNLMKGVVRFLIINEKTEKHFRYKTRRPTTSVQSHKTSSGFVAKSIIAKSVINSESSSNLKPKTTLTKTVPSF